MYSAVYTRYRRMPACQDCSKFRAKYLKVGRQAVYLVSMIPPSDRNVLLGRQLDTLDFSKGVIVRISELRLLTHLSM